MDTPIRQLKSSLVYSGSKLQIYEDELQLPSERILKRERVVHPGAVVILPIMSDGRIVFIRQYRHAIKQFLLELPAGTLEKDELPEVCAHREIMEEIGFRAKTWLSLGVLYPAPGFCDEVQYLFLAQELTPEVRPADEDEFIELQTMTKEETQKAICQGELNDAKSIAILARAEALGHL